MCTIIFIAKIALQFQIKLQVSVIGLCPESAGDLGSLQTPCLTRNETLVMALKYNTVIS
jgi:hypothetical protein